MHHAVMPKTFSLCIVICKAVSSIRNDRLSKWTQSSKVEISANIIIKKWLDIKDIYYRIWIFFLNSSLEQLTELGLYATQKIIYKEFLSWRKANKIKFYHEVIFARLISLLMIWDQKCFSYSINEINWLYFYNSSCFDSLFIHILYGNSSVALFCRKSRSDKSKVNADFEI